MLHGKHICKAWLILLESPAKKSLFNSQIMKGFSHGNKLFFLSQLHSFFAKERINLSHDAFYCFAGFATLAKRESQTSAGTLEWRQMFETRWQRRICLCSSGEVLLRRQKRLSAQEEKEEKTAQTWSPIACVCYNKKVLGFYFAPVPCRSLTQFPDPLCTFSFILFLFSPLSWEDMRKENFVDGESHLKKMYKAFQLACFWRFALCN